MDVNEIYTVRNSIENIVERKNKLLQNFKECPKPDGDIYTLGFDGDQVSVKFMNVTAQSTPRTVKLPDSSFGYEFLFSVCLQQDLDVEVFRFYLTNNGKLYGNADLSIPLGDFDQVKNIESIMFKIVSGTLKSDFYLPSVVLGK